MLRYVVIVTGFFLMLGQLLFSTVVHHSIDSSKINNNTVEWLCEEVSPFTELVVSWNACRPEVGEYAVYLSVKTDEWTEDLLYAIWGANAQRTFASKGVALTARTNEDTLEVLGGKHATGFCVKVKAQNGASLDGLWALHASFCDVATFKEKIALDGNWKADESVLLPVLGRSQIILDHPRNLDLCSPTSTSAVVSHLSNRTVSATDFAAKVWDGGFDIYGNWIFSVAASADCLGKQWKCYMGRYDSFEQIYANLKDGVPTLVSVRGPLPGTIYPYAGGHFIAVIGYDRDSDRILCMDPAYPSDQETLVSYPRESFIQACARRGYIGYFFTPP